MDDDTAARLSLSDLSRARPNNFAACGHAYTFIAAILVILLWAASGPAFGYSDTWQLIINTGTTIITFLMVFLIQNTQNRDTTAIQLKLDELIRANENAQNRMMKLEDLMEESLAAGPLDAIREPLEAAQEGLAEVSGNIEEAKSRLSVAMNELDRLGAGIPCSAWLRGTPDLIGGDRIRLPPL
jgi:low affinity Fe/Cu permease